MDNDLMAIADVLEAVLAKHYFFYRDREHVFNEVSMQIGMAAFSTYGIGRITVHRPSSRVFYSRMGKILFSLPLPIIEDPEFDPDEWFKPLLNVLMEQKFR